MRTKINSKREGKKYEIKKFNSISFETALKNGIFNITFKCFKEVTAQTRELCRSQKSKKSTISSLRNEFFKTFGGYVNDGSLKILIRIIIYYVLLFLMQ